MSAKQNFNALDWAALLQFLCLCHHPAKQSLPHFVMSLMSTNAGKTEVHAVSPMPGMRDVKQRYSVVRILCISAGADAGL